MEIQADTTSLPATLRADFHLHSRESDGQYAPKELVRLAAERGLELIALTDHDTVSGLPEAREAAREYGCYFVNGVELEATLKDKEGSYFAIHILGYGIDPENPALLDVLETIRENRVTRAESIHSRLETLGVSIPFAEIREQSRGESLSRVHIAQVLQQYDHVDSMDEAFNQYLGNGKPAYVPRSGPGPEELVMLIHEADGEAVWAHPYYTKRDEYIDRLVEAGIDGIECSHSEFSESMTRRYREMAKDYGLFMTGGSDFHGTLEEDFQLGDWWIDVSLDDLPFPLAVDPG